MYTVPFERDGETRPAPSSPAFSPLDTAAAVLTEWPTEVPVVSASPLITELVVRTLRSAGSPAVASSLTAAVTMVAARTATTVVLLPARGLDADPLLAAMRQVPHARLVVVMDTKPPAVPRDPTLDLVLVDGPEALVHAVRAGHRVPEPLKLTPAQLRVMQCLAEGETPATASKRLGISLATVNNHLAQINRVLGTVNVTQAVLRCLRHRMVDPHPGWSPVTP